MTPLFSIIVANYNKENYIRETIQSVLSQTLTEFELIIVDDCSSDNSKVILEEESASANGKIKVIFSDATHGANYCRNLGIQKASGKYVIILDADDLLDKECLAHRFKAVEENPNNNLWVFSMATFDCELNNITSNWIPAKENCLERFLSHKLPWCIVQPVWDAAYLKREKGFDESFVRLQDVELHTRVLLNGAKYCVVGGKPDCYYRVDQKRLNFNYDIFFERWVDGTVSFFNKFYPQLNKELAGKLHITLLYTIDGVWAGLKSGNISFDTAMKHVNVLLTETGLQEKNDRVYGKLRRYFLVKSKFSFNVRGLRFLYEHVVL